MTPTELIAEARELDRKATPGPWKVKQLDDCFIEPKICEIPANGRYDYRAIGANADFITRSRTLIPALCDALEQAQGNLDPVEMAKVAMALKENTRLLSRLAEVTAERDAAVADLQAFVENPCVVCKHVQDQQYCYQNCQNRERENYRAWEWRGKEPDNAND